jgi:hypothetical protein
MFQGSPRLIFIAKPAPAIVPSSAPMTRALPGGNFRFRSCSFSSLRSLEMLTQLAPPIAAGRSSALNASSPHIAETLLDIRG